MSRQARNKPTARAVAPPPDSRRGLVGGKRQPPEPAPAAVAALADDLAARARPARSLEQVLAAVGPLAEVARRWLDPRDAIRREALQRLPFHSPFSRAMWVEALDAMFSPITADALEAFVRRELAGRLTGRFPRLIGQVLAGNVPAAAVQSVFCGLLTGAAQLVKPAREDRLWPVLLAKSIEAVSADLAGRLAVVYWPGESAPHNAALAKRAARVVVFGQTAAIEGWRRLIRPADRLIAHGPRMSLALIELAAGRAEIAALADAVARDVALYDQQGCLSVQQVYLTGPAGTSERAVSRRSRRFASALGEALSRLARRWPIPPGRDLAARLAIRRLRENCRMRRLTEPANSPSRPWLLAGPPGRFDWTLVGSCDDAVQSGPGGRSVLLSRVGSSRRAVEAIAAAARWIQGVALHAGPETDRLADTLTRRLGIPYVCQPGQLQRPPFGWPNDGVPALRSLRLDRRRGCG